MDEKLRLVQATQEELTERFKALSHDALAANTQSFLEYAKTQLEKTQEVAKVELDARSTALDGLVAPLREALEKVDGKLAELDQSRERAQGALGAQLRALAESQDALRQQTERLVGALRAPNTRGRWGEVQLRRVVELAGMVDRCDFTEQTRVEVEGGTVRHGNQGELNHSVRHATWVPAGDTRKLDRKGSADISPLAAAALAYQAAQTDTTSKGWVLSL